VTHYEKVTREEIARRNYTEGTTRAYLRALRDLAEYFHQSPERLTREQIREYTAHHAGGVDVGNPQRSHLGASPARGVPTALSPPAAQTDGLALPRRHPPHSRRVQFQYNGRPRMSKHSGSCVGTR